MLETKANGYSSESTDRELSNEYQRNRVLMGFKNVCVLVPRTKVASALERQLWLVVRLVCMFMEILLLVITDINLTACVKE